MRALPLVHVGVGTTFLIGCAAYAAPMPAPTIKPAQIERLVRTNPLYPELAHYDRAIAALKRVDATWSERDRAAAVAQSRTSAATSFSSAVRALDAAHVAADAGLARERVALETLTGRPQSSASIVASYRDDLMRQERQAIAQARTDFTGRVDAAYVQRRQQLEESESTLALSLVRRDANRMMLLRLRAQELGIDPTARRTAATRLDAIERNHVADLAMLRSRDAAALDAYRARLVRNASVEEAHTIVEIERRTAANFAARMTPPAIPSRRLSSAIAALERSQPLANAEAPDAAHAFARAERNLGSRFSSMASMDASAARSACAEIARLEVERAELYAAIVAWARAQPLPHGSATRAAQGSKR